MKAFRFLCQINENSKLAGLIAIGIMSAVVIGCALWLIIKKCVLNRKYRSDEQFVKEYRKKLKEKTKNEKEEVSRPDMIGEDF